MIKMNEIECESCIKRKTMYCPNSNECFETDDKLHWENRITLLEKYSKLQNNWNELKKWLFEDGRYIDSYSSYELRRKIQELERGKEWKN